MSGGAGCGLAKLFLEFSAVGDYGEKQQPLDGVKVQCLMRLIYVGYAKLTCIRR